MSYFDELTEKQAKEFATDTMDIKGYTVYFVPVEIYQGLCAVAFKNGHPIYHEIALNQRPYGEDIPSADKLKEIYIRDFNKTLFTEDELKTVKDYDDYCIKDYFLRNYYCNEVDRLSMFGIEIKPGVYDMGVDMNKKKRYYPITNAISFCYMKEKDKDFVKHQFDLHTELLKAKETAEKSSEEYIINAFVSEMCNHEYAINWQGDWDVCSCFGDCEYRETKNYIYYLTEMGMEDKIDAFRKAKNKYWRMAKDNDWF